MEVNDTAADCPPSPPCFAVLSRKIQRRQKRQPMSDPPHIIYESSCVYDIRLEENVPSSPSDKCPEINFDEVSTTLKLLNVQNLQKVSSKSQFKEVLQQCVDMFSKVSRLKDAHLASSAASPSPPSSEQTIVLSKLIRALFLKNTELYELTGTRSDSFYLFVQPHGFGYMYRDGSGMYTSCYFLQDRYPLIQFCEPCVETSAPSLLLFGVVLYAYIANDARKDHRSSLARLLLTAANAACVETFEQVGDYWFNILSALPSSLPASLPASLPVSTPPSPPPSPPQSSTPSDILTQQFKKSKRAKTSHQTSHAAKCVVDGGGGNCGALEISKDGCENDDDDDDTDDAIHELKERFHVPHLGDGGGGHTAPITIERFLGMNSGEACLPRTPISARTPTLSPVPLPVVRVEALEEDDHPLLTLALKAFLQKYDASEVLVIKRFWNDVNTTLKDL